MGTGAEGGSALVPEVVWASSASMRLVGCVIIFMDIDVCMELMSMPGMGGVEACCWAARVSGTNTTSESRAPEWLLNMRDLSSEDVRCRQAAQ
jgi:hypothetical protein